MSVLTNIDVQECVFVCIRVVWSLHRSQWQLCWLLFTASLTFYHVVPSTSRTQGKGPAHGDDILSARRQ